MTYFLYVTTEGHADVSTHELDLDLFPGHQFLGESDEMPDVMGKRYVDGQWVRASGEPVYAQSRRYEYPKLGDQMDMIWHAMDRGLIPKIEPLYGQIKAVKDKYPKPSN